MLRPPAAQTLEPGVQLAVAAEGGLVGRALLHAEGQRVHLVLHAVHPGEGGAQHVLHRIARRVHRYLGDKTYPAACAQLYLALVRF